MTELKPPLIEYFDPDPHEVCNIIVSNNTFEFNGIKNINTIVDANILLIFIRFLKYKNYYSQLILSHIQ